MTKIWMTAIAAAVATVFVGNAWAQDTGEGERPPELVEELIKQLDEIIPQWDDRVLNVPETKDWTAELDITTAVRAIGARTLAPELERAPKATTFVETKSEALRVVKDRGYVRYANRERAVDLSREVGPLPEPPEVADRGIELLSRLGLPRDEFAKPQIQTQMAAGGSVEAEEPERIDEVYRLMVVSRVINDLPVVGSNALIAMTSKAEVQRLRTQWPVFAMNEGDKLLERATVLQQSAEVLLDHGVEAGGDLRAQLAYAPAADVPGNSYVPVVIIGAAVEPTPVMISVPIVLPGDVDER